MHPKELDTDTKANSENIDQAPRFKKIMLNSAKHEILNAQIYKKYQETSIFSLI